MAKNYGSTWWGQQWLNALSNIDFSNRLPRGRTYANAGRVSAVKISGNKIKAKVQGTRPTPYDVEITIPLFSIENKQRLVNEATRNSSLVARLLNRELPQEMLYFCESQGIKIFPKSWRDFTMKCSCPDLAVPCKHIAAVIYILANEIDRNPFLIFEVHGLDLVTELEEQEVHIAEKMVERITNVKELVSDSGFEVSGLDETEQPVTQNLKPKTRYPETHPLDFTLIPDIGAQILTLFKPHPLFLFEKDFKVIVERLYAGAGKAAGKLLKGNFVPRNLDFSIVPEDGLQLVFDKNLLPKELAILDKKGSTKKIKKNLLDDLVQVLLTYDLETLRRTHPSTASLLDIFSFSLNLAQNGAIMPQLLECEADTFRIRWLPAVIDTAVKDLFEKIAGNLPPGLLVIQGGKEQLWQSPEEMLNTLCSMFIGYSVAEAGNIDEHRLAKMFQFTNESQPIHFDDPELPQLLQLWLNNFYLTHRDYVPLVKVEEVDGDFAIELMVENRRESLRPPMPLSDVFRKKELQPIKYDVLKDVMLLSEYFPNLSEIVEKQGGRVVFDSTSFVEVFLKMLPAVSLFGINVLLPKGLKHLVRPQASLLAKKSPAQVEGGTFLRFEDLMEFDWQIALGDRLLPVEAFEHMVRNLDGIVKVNDQYILLEEDDLIKLFQKLERPPKLRGFEVLKTLMAEEYEGVKIGLSPDAAMLIRELIQPAEVPLPRDLQAEMRPYQRTGYEWMLKNTRLGFGSLIADDMGLGKTLQVIAAILKFKEEGMLARDKVLVIVPTSLLTNWRKEIEKFAPTLKAGVYHGQKRSLGVADPDIIITTYGVARTEQELLKKLPWYCIVVDEAQNIKNDNAAQTQSVKSFPAAIRIAMSGTPVENRLSEFWSIMDFTNKGYLGSPKQFADTFAKPIQRDHDQKQAELFKRITAPFLLRRLKSDKSIISDLPDKIENNQYAALTPEQAAIYESVVRRAMKAIYDESEEIRRQGLVLKMITALKQVCNHPFQFLKKGSAVPELSGKTELLFSLLDNIYENGEKTLIFTQYQEMGELLTQFIKEFYGKDPLFLHGGTSRPHRDEMVETFQNDLAADTFILSLRAGGTGLNLTAASNVIHYDLWWNPAVEAQATDRAYRIGQMKNVMVWRLITQGTFEEKIDEMIKMKKNLANLTVATGENWIGNLSNEELELLVGL